jgi:hypothetical protein
MTYSKSMGTMYAVAGLGALGFDRLASGAQMTFVSSVAGVHGLPSSATASLVPSRIEEYLRAEGLAGVDTGAGWAAGGRVWLKYPGNDMDSAGRRQAVVRALSGAARSLGPNVYFELTGHGRVPAGTSSAPREEQPEQNASVTITLEPMAVAGSLATIETSSLQRLLSQKGFNPGATDGRWGPNTSGALNQAAAQLGMEAVAVGSDDKRTVQLTASVLEGLRGLPDRQAPSQPAPPAPAYTAEIVPDGAGFSLPDWLPWTVGAVALAGIGGYFIYRGKSRAVAANRRRLRRRRTSRRAR